MCAKGCSGMAELCFLSTSPQLSPPGIPQGGDWLYRAGTSWGMNY